MKTFLTIICILVMAFTVHAADISFIWDANTEIDLAGYKIHRSITSGSNYTEIGNIPCLANDSVCCVFTDLNLPDGTWYWILTAYDAYGNESGYSNELSNVLDTTPPNPPQNFSISGIIP